jgi:L-lactate dehydrogenase
MKHSKIAIIGAGLVGSTTAYALLLQNIIAEIILVDINEVRCKGEILDLSDALSLDDTSQIKIGNSRDAANADIIIIAAGQPQKINQSRTELLKANNAIVTLIFEEITPINPEAIIIIITNPVDILTLKVQALSGLPKNQVFGSGTFLDTQRLCTILSHKLSISAKSIDTYILGEHGDSQFVAWSSTKIGGIAILDFPNITKKNLDEIATEVKDKAYEIIACKGATYYGIAACVARICKAIIFDQKLVLPLSTYHEEFKLCLSMPVVLGENGIEKILPISLNTNEQKKLIASAEQLTLLIK